MGQRFNAVVVNGKCMLEMGTCLLRVAMNHRDLAEVLQRISEVGWCRLCTAGKGAFCYNPISALVRNPFRKIGDKGWVRVRSQEGEGTRFSLVLPAAQAQYAEQMN